MSHYTYDEHAQFFPYFFLSFLAIILIPATYSLLPKRSSLLTKCSCPPCSKKYTALKRSATSFKLSKTLLLITAGWVLFAYMAYLIATVTVETTFYDPYKILGISQSATPSQIRTHYKRQSLKFHPDKVKPLPNQTTEMLVSHFVELTKAYKALTDDTIRRNFEEFGHPDGKQDFSIGIALPRWIVQGRNSAYVLGVYALLIGVLLPYYVGRWWSASKQLTKDGIRIKSAETFFRNFSDHIDPDTAVDMIALSDEYRVAYKNNSALTHLNTRTSQGTPKTWAQILLPAYLNRVNLSKDLEKDQRLLLENALRLERGLLTIALAFGHLQPILTAMNLSQSIIQAIPIGGSPLLQITGVTQEIVHKIHDRNPNIQTVDDLMSLDESERRMLFEDLDEKGYNEAVNVAKQIPVLDVVNSYFKVPGDNIVSPGAIVQFIVRARTRPPGLKPTVEKQDLIDRHAEHSLSKPKKPPAIEEQAHAPLYPKPHVARYWIFIGDAKQDRLIVPPTLLPSVASQVETMSLQFQVPQSPGLYTFQGYIKSDTYLGTDHILNVQLHIEEQTLDTNQEETKSDSSDDDSSEDEQSDSESSDSD